jgi:hypothetical protein
MQDETVSVVQVARLAAFHRRGEHRNILQFSAMITPGCRKLARIQEAGAPGAWLALYLLKEIKLN